MARPVKTLTHDGEEWLAMLTGGSMSDEGYRSGVLFEAQTTNRVAFGRLLDMRPENFTWATADQLRRVLLTALSGDDD